MDTLIISDMFAVDEIHVEDAIIETAGDFLPDEFTHPDPVTHSLEEAERPPNPREKPPDWDWDRFDWDIAVTAGIGVGILGGLGGLLYYSEKKRNDGIQDGF